ncbi:60S acidic ribosomal protein P1, putative [Trichomonas vaginalis G3]|uniref:60S acidic ribosomal protein P1, putative n=1 Tax=Trichomonas vaginalis (strain ATCC PRA-98 / G3) TaxID=412133 RepID=A2DFD3_TRIV3|nr:translational elongation [Trichomonas vaginalis G3]EAY20861.1 60S acidic ribosomal protein P1, putative [Trichomonas vaginalis G3]KAI5521529.1 translational elongation [Trichomonas vaginalis G3]|eukprot:XP_001581847.1 60S acidic ribosomal protein P1 [Trichomonas vaginalis G3]
MSKELACVYAALILHDGDKEITADALQKIIDASGLQTDKFWVQM